MPTEPNALIVLVLVGLVAGWLAGLVVQGGGFGIVGNIIIGIIGAFIGFWLFRTLGIHIGVSGIAGDIIVAAIGAIVLLFILGLIRA